MQKMIGMAKYQTSICLLWGDPGKLQNLQMNQ